jgi:uncharacterized membrane protein YraQ (UPF0718 family)
MTLLVDALLWMIVAALAFATAMRGRALFHGAGREGLLDFARLLPRLALGVLGSGYIAAALPPDLIGRWFGPDAGLLGVAIAVIGGALTPGGPVVGFSIGAAALKGGAGPPQVIAYTTAWALFALQRCIMWELPVMPARFVWLRAAASLPLPFLAAWGAMLLGRP